MAWMSSSRTSGTPAATSTRSGNNQKLKTERRKNVAYHNGVASYEGPENNDGGQRLEENVVEHKGIGVTNHDEVDDDDTEDYDDQEVEQHHDDLGGGQDLADDEEYAAERDQEREEYDEEHCAQNDGCAMECIKEGGYADDRAVALLGERLRRLERRGG